MTSRAALSGEPHERVAELRRERGDTLETFGALIGGASKGVMSELERGLRRFTPEQALEIERISGGRIDAGELNPIIAAARADIDCDHDGCPRVKAGHDNG